MYVIVGLGNPDKKYEHTRHNIGFDVIDALADKYNISVTDKKHKALCGSGVIEGMKVLLVKPQTYMNLSGESVAEVMNFYKLDPDEEMIVIFDDISLEPGRIRIRKKGSAGGHNGLKNIIAHLGTDQFPRIKVGVGMPEHPDHEMIDWVIGKPKGDEAKLLRQTHIRLQANGIFRVHISVSGGLHIERGKAAAKCLRHFPCHSYNAFIGRRRGQAHKNMLFWYFISFVPHIFTTPLKRYYSTKM